MDFENSVVLPILTAEGKVQSSTLVDADLYVALSAHRWELDREGYVRRFGNIEGRRYEIRLHRLVMACSPGDGLIIDHINRNPRDNRRANLRFVSVSENNMNRVLAEKAKPYWRQSKNRWHSAFKYKKKRYHVGYFSDYAEAEEALQKARRAVMGPLAG